MLVLPARIASKPDPAAILGMMADEPDVMDEVYRLVTAARDASRMRLTDG